MGLGSCVGSTRGGGVKDGVGSATGVSETTVARAVDVRVDTPTSGELTGGVLSFPPQAANTVAAVPPTPNRKNLRLVNLRTSLSADPSLSLDRDHFRRRRRRRDDLDLLSRLPSEVSEERCCSEPALAWRPDCLAVLSSAAPEPGFLRPQVQFSP